MKRVVFTLVATVVGVIALLSFKSHSTPQASAGSGLPSAALSPGAITPTPPASTGSTSAPPEPGGARTATGQAVQTRYGVVQVKVTVDANRIIDVAFVQLTAADSQSAQINSFAAPTLLRETLAAQSAQIDVVSGATYTSGGYIESLQNALDQVGFK